MVVALACFGAFSVLLAAAPVPPAGVESGDDVVLAPAERLARAKRHFESGRTHFDLGEYEAAVREFEAGYRLKPQPLFLYNIAQCQLRAGAPEKALASFRRYLEVEPGAPEGREVRQHIADLEKRLAPPVESAGPAAVEVMGALPPAAPPAAPPAPAPPGRAWRWVALGAALLAAGIGGFVVFSHRDGESPPTSMLGNVPVPR